MSEGLVQIGEVAERLGLSLRTVRHYEEVGLVVPERTPGGFRLYSEEAIARPALIKRMKPLGFSLEEMRDLLDITDRLAAGDEDPSLVSRLQMVERAVAARRLGLSVPGMKSRAQRARVQLGNLIAECCRVELGVRRAVREVEQHGPCPC